MVFVQFVTLFATTLVCEGTTEGETSHSLLTWRMAKPFLIDSNPSRPILGTNTNKSPLTVSAKLVLLTSVLLTLTQLVIQHFKHCQLQY
jgi:hypothetical protein